MKILLSLLFILPLSASDLTDYIHNEIQGFKRLQECPHEDPGVSEYIQGRIDAYEDVLWYMTYHVDTVKFVNNEPTVKVVRQNN